MMATQPTPTPQKEKINRTNLLYTPTFVHESLTSTLSYKRLASTPLTAPTVASTPATSLSNTSPNNVAFLGDSTESRNLFRDSTPPRSIFRDATPASPLDISPCPSPPSPLMINHDTLHVSTAIHQNQHQQQQQQQQAHSSIHTQRRRPRKSVASTASTASTESTLVHFGIERRKASRQPETSFFHSTKASPSSTPSTSSSSEDESSPDRNNHNTRRRSTTPLPESDKNGALQLCLRIAKINTNKLVLLLCTVTIVSCGWTLSAFPLLPSMQDSPMSPSRQYVLQEVKAPSDGGLRGKLVQMAGKKDYWKQRDAHARHAGNPKERKTSNKRTQTTRSVKKSSKGLDKSRQLLKFTPPPMATITVKPTFEPMDAAFYVDSIKKKNYPLVVSFGAKALHKPVSVYPAEFTDNTQYYGLYDSADERLSKMELRDPYENDQCVPMQPWQTTYHPWCNGMHELALESMGLHGEDDAHLFGTKGYWRNAWKLDLLGGQHHSGDREKIVLKTLKFQHDFEDAHFEHDRVDAIAMERLTSSPHVINIFGFCGHSVMTEFADGSTVGELADKSRKTKLARLKIARDIANGLADVHGIDGDGNATFVHLDINPANVVSIGGTLKLNDFNIGIILKWNTTSNTQCGFPAQYPNPQWRSPEEARNEQFLTEKVDIFSMGHIFFRLICGHEPWNKLEIGGKPSKEEIHEKVQRGVLPFIPNDVMQTDNPEVAAIRDVMLKCYSADPSARPCARDIANELESILNKLSAENGNIESSLSHGKS